MYVCVAVLQKSVWLCAKIHTIAALITNVPLKLFFVGSITVTYSHRCVFVSRNIVINLCVHGSPMHDYTKTHTHNDDVSLRLYESISVIWPINCTAQYPQICIVQCWHNREKLH